MTNITTLFCDLMKSMQRWKTNRYLEQFREEFRVICSNMPGRALLVINLIFGLPCSVCTKQMEHPYLAALSKTAESYGERCEHRA